MDIGGGELRVGDQMLDQEEEDASYLDVMQTPPRRLRAEPLCIVIQGRARPWKQASWLATVVARSNRRLVAAMSPSPHPFPRR
jgi:hypothetical protein